MPDTTIFDPIDANLFPDPKRLVIRPFSPDGLSDFAGDGPRARRVLSRIVALPDMTAQHLAMTLLDSLRERQHCKSALKRDPGRFGRKHLCGLYILRV